MPALPRMRIEDLAELARQLRYQSAESARRQLERAEALAVELLKEETVGAGEGRGYPLEWVRFRITGLRPEDGAGGPVVLVREALLGDLAALIDRLSAAAGVREGDVAGWMGMEALRARWGVSRKTIERLRRKGLIGRRVVGEGGKKAAQQRVVFDPRVVALFERRGLHRSAATRRPVSGRRADDEDRAEIVALARRYRAEHGWSKRRCVERIARELARSEASVRRAIERHEREAGGEEAGQIFGVRKRLSAKMRGRAAVAQRRGMDAAAIAGKLKRSRATAYRVAMNERVARVRAVAIVGPVGPMFERPDAAEVLLAPRAVGEGLGGPGAATVGELVVLAESQPPPSAAVENARAVASAFLRHLVREWARERAKGTGTAAVTMARLHEMEVRLLWASRLKAELMRSEMPAALRTVKTVAGRDVREFAARGGAGAAGGAGVSGPGLVRAMLEGLKSAVDVFDPFRGGRLAAAVGVSVNRTVTAWLRSHGADGGGRRAAPGGGAAGLATVRCDSAAIGFDWTRRVDPWQVWLEPEGAVVRWVREAGDGDDRAALERRVVAMRYGLEGAPPRTPREVGEVLGTTAARVTAIERRVTARVAEACRKGAERG